MTSGYPLEWYSTSFNMVEDGSASHGQYSNTFGVNNTPIYINGKIHKFVGFEFNTDCFNCTVTAKARELQVLDLGVIPISACWMRLGSSRSMR